MTEFGDQICFLPSPNRKRSEVVVSSEFFTAESVHHNDYDTLQKAAKILQRDILDKFKDNPQPTWPPTTSELESDKFSPPTSIVTFMKNTFDFE